MKSPKQILESLRQKNDIEKRIIAFNLSLVITVFIIIVWVISTFYGGAIDSASSEINNSAETVKKQTATPISAVKGLFTELFNNDR